MASEEGNGGANVAVLPTDVLYEILLRLPAKVLCRLRLVCRSWRSITSDRTFAKAHSSRHPLVVGLAGCGREVHFLDPYSGNIVKRISTGQAWDIRDLSTDLDLICVSQDQGKATCVIDPSSGVVTVLPLPTTNNTRDDDVKGRLRIMDSTMLGQVPSTGEYKVLRLGWCFKGGNRPEQVCDVITLLGGSSGRRGWRVVPGPPPPILVSTAPMQRALVKGVAYFLQTLVPSNVPNDIVSFDLSTEEWRPTTHRGPLNNDGHRKTTPFLCLVQMMNGCLCLATVCKARNYGDFLVMDLWFSEDLEKGLWTKRYSLQCAPISLGGGFVSPLMVLNDERVLIWKMKKRVLGAYDTRINESIDLTTVATEYRSVVVYRGSLL